MALQIGASKEMLDKSIAALKAIFDAPDYRTWALSFRDSAGQRYANDLAKKAAQPTQDQATSILQSAAANPLAPVSGGAASLLGGAKPWAGGAMMADIQAKPLQMTAAQVEQAARDKALAEFAALSPDAYLQGLSEGKYIANGAMPGFSLEGIITDQTDGPEAYFNAIRNAGPDAVDALLRQQYEASLKTEASPFGIPQLAIGIGAAGTLAGGLNALGGGNLFSGGNPLSGLLNSPNANAVPGLSTGVTTPSGGGLIGTGALNTAPIGIMGGAPLSASPLATAGMQGSSLWDRLVDRARSNLNDPGDIAQRLGVNMISNAMTPAAPVGSGDASQMMAGQGFNPRDWPTDIYPGEVQKIPGYLPGLLMAMQARRGLLGG